MMVQFHHAECGVLGASNNNGSTTTCLFLTFVVFYLNPIGSIGFCVSIKSKKQSILLSLSALVGFCYGTIVNSAVTLMLKTI